MKNKRFLRKMTNLIFIGGNIFLLLTASLSSCKEEKSKLTDFELLPAPRTIELKESILINPKKFNTIYLYTKANENDRFAANLLKDELNKLFNFNFIILVIKIGP